MNKLKFSTIITSFFYLLLILLPFNARHIFNFNQIEKLEGFREPISYSLFAFDIIFVIFIIFLVAELIKKQLKTTFRPLWQNNKNIFILLAVFLAVCLISVYSAENKSPAFYQGVRLFQACLFFLGSKILFSDTRVFYRSAFLIFLSGVIQSFLAIWQFILQRSIGLKLIGESLISPSILGVAKIDLADDKIIRAYGTFPHPNILAAFLLVALFSGLWWIKKRNPFHLPTLSIPQSNRFDRYLPIIGLLIILIGLFLTFSRAAWLVAGLLFFWLMAKNLSLLKNKYRPSSFSLIVLTLGVIFFAIFGLRFFTARICVFHCPNDQSWQLRRLYNLAAIDYIKNKPFFGLGLGNFTLQLKKTLKVESSSGGLTILNPWEIQPAHNLYLLIASEIGLVGLSVFLFLIIYSIFRLKNPLLALAFFGFLVLGLFDHYFWTTAQGQWLFAIAWGMMMTDS